MRARVHAMALMYFHSDTHVSTHKNKQRNKFKLLRTKSQIIIHGNHALPMSVLHVLHAVDSCMNTYYIQELYEHGHLILLHHFVFDEQLRLSFYSNSN